MRLYAVLLAIALTACATSPPARSESQCVPRDPNTPRAQLDKCDIVTGMQAIKPKVGTCFDRYHQVGMYNVAITIGPAGRVTTATVNGPDPDTNSCIRQVAATASFPTFTGAPSSIVYPFIFR